MRIQEAIEEFTLAKDWTAESAVYYERRLRPFQEWCDGQGVARLEDITPSTVRRYFLHLRERPSETTGRPLKSKTAYGHAQVVKTLLKWCHLEELLTADVMRRVQLPIITQEVIPAFTVDEVKALLKAAATPRDAALLAVLVDTGARAREVCGLCLEDVHLAAGDAYVTIRMGKGRRWREVSIGKRAALLLSRYIHQHRPATELPNVFLARGRKPLQPEGLHRMLVRTGQRAGIEGKRLSAHSYRHSSATLLVEAGADILRVSKRLGHSRLSTTQSYLRSLSSKSVRQAPSILDAI